VAPQIQLVNLAPVNQARRWVRPNSPVY